MDRKNLTKKIVVMGLLIALEVVLSRLLSIPTKITKISLGFIPIAIAAMLYGPLWAGIGGALADFVGALAFPVSSYFLGFTVTAFFRGLLFGLCLYKKDGDDKFKWETLLRAFLASAATGLLLTVGLNTFWLCVFLGNTFSVIIVPRLVQCAVMIPLQTVFIPTVCKKICDAAKMLKIAN